MAGEACPRAPKRKASPDTRRNAERHPSRAKYDEAEYRRNRQRALDKTKGKCAGCGKQIAEKKVGRWVTHSGHIHHIKPLCNGGSNAMANLVPLCVDCHAKADAARRRMEKGKGQ